MSRRTSRRVDDRPSFQFYPKDWLGDNDLRAVSLAARGLWIDMLARMWAEEIRGTITGDVRRLSRIIGEAEDEIAPLVDELLREGVASWYADGEVFDDGDQPGGARICCRVMWRQWAISRARADAGRKGGSAQAKRKQNSENGKQKKRHNPQDDNDLRRKEGSKNEAKTAPSSSDPVSIANAIAGTGRDPAGSRGPESIGEIGLGVGPEWPTNGLHGATQAELVEACLLLEKSDERANMRRFWQERVEALHALEGGHIFICDELKKIADAGDTTKDVGSFKNAAAYLTKKTSSFLKGRNYDT